MMSSLSAIQSLAELQAKFRPEALMSFDSEGVAAPLRDGSESSDNTLTHSKMLVNLTCRNALAMKLSD
ncbi:hypothetical protein Y032_0008g124 [Ancylostoma ceylanicum]|uniref:Uncharacterized protein n=1 Tax=Ancylostoma ceylanicum TaxID=53326 RepID=A0A016VK74_9BILA|nr:hypothetical protein Y032_0008g124 [Ancylostoma ceylanicum]